MNRLSTVHRFTWTNVARTVLMVAAVGLLAVSAVTVMAMGSWLVDLVQV